MPSRTFSDAAGLLWEVFEVHRLAKAPAAVSAGLEQGWLSFVQGAEKRRLAPFPADWETLDDGTLAGLCARARRASPSRIERTPATATHPAETHINVSTRSSRSTDAFALRPDTQRVPASSHDAQRADDPQELEPVPDADDVEGAVRRFTQDARASGMAAIETMVRLRAELVHRFPGETHLARDMRRVRRWFVDAYYFQRD